MFLWFVKNVSIGVIKLTVNQAADLYFEMKKGLMKPSSYVNAQRLYRDHIRQYFEDMDCETITSREMQKFYNSLVNRKMKSDPAKTLSSKTAKDIFTFAKTILYFAMEEGEMTERRFKTKTPYGFRDIDNGQDEYFKEEQYKKLMLLSTTIDEKGKNYNQSKMFVMLALTTGMRIGEICGLKWNDVDFESNTIKVQRTVQRIVNIDGSSYINVGEPKSKSSKRVVILTEIAKETLFKYKKYFGAENCLPNNYILTNKSTPAEPRTVRQGYSRLLKANDIQYIHPHGLRHTFTTYAIDNGIDVKTTSQLLGHAHTSMTLDTYTHITEKQMKNTVNRLNEITSL